MKRFLTTMVLIALVLSANAQQQYILQRGCNEKTYAEVIELIDKIEKISIIEKMEGIDLDNEMLSTYGGEVILRKDGNSIIITLREYTAVLENLIANPHNKRYDINSIITDLHIHTVKLFEYIHEKMYFNKCSRMIKNIYIKTNTRTGAAYIQIEYYRL
jgi:hypothetical protein